MLLIITKKATKKEIQQVSEDLDGYIKIVADVGRKMLTAGGLRHVEGEQKLLEDGSKQEDLWGGGLDLETNEIDYNSVINLRPSQKNPSRDILSEEVRIKFNDIVRSLLR